AAIRSPRSRSTAWRPACPTSPPAAARSSSSARARSCRRWPHSRPGRRDERRRIAVSARVLNVAGYRFAEIGDPAALRDRLRSVCAAHGLRGSVLVAPEGLNLFLAGGESGVDAALDAVRRLPGFGDLRAKRSWSEHVPFARLKVKLKR